MILSIRGKDLNFGIGWGEKSTQIEHCVEKLELIWYENGY
jgi:hypothetical protein